MFKPWSFGIYYAVHFVWVKRLNDNSYQFQRCWGTSSRGTSPSEMYQTCLDVTTLTRAEIEQINTNLICDKNEDERVLIENYYRKASSFNKKKLGFFLLEPKTTISFDGLIISFFIL